MYMQYALLAGNPHEGTNIGITLYTLLVLWLHETPDVWFTSRML